MTHFTRIPQPGDLLAARSHPTHRIILFNVIDTPAGPRETGDLYSMHAGEHALVVSTRVDDDDGFWSLLVNGRTWFYDTLEAWESDWDLL